ncbi:hypothetical protein X566_05635 [Afipia sp. P52-10]|jgi:hypothetical protein|uniref:hypothetical protein n=1 Tax=Afipia sp. P52-10 TaxID=1429916 RepID=UPI0003DF28F8|nr:hypothetical protein [Afipia sp. P52-10]ETR77159.1 hypothetical protein X566_05635 [Afipia sp. P52-10]
MSHTYSIDDEVHHQSRGPQGRTGGGSEPEVYTIVRCMPIEADGRLRYRIKSKTGNIERIVTEDQLSRLV